MNEYISNMHRSLYLLMVNWCFVPILNRSDAVLKDAPASKQYSFSMLSHIIYLFVKTFPVTDISTIKSCHVIRFIILFNPFQSFVQCTCNTLVPFIAKDNNG